MAALGILNCWSPLHPDGEYDLDLRRHDERTAAKILLELAAAEAGENITAEKCEQCLFCEQMPPFFFRSQQMCGRAAPKVY